MQIQFIKVKQNKYDFKSLIMNDSLTPQEHLKIFIEMLLYLHLTYFEGEGDLTNYLTEYIKDKNLSEYLTKRIATAAAKAYLKSYGNPDKYIPLCSKYVAQSSNDSLSIRKFLEKFLRFFQKTVSLKK